MKKTFELGLSFKGLIDYIHVGQCYSNALLVADVYAEIEYVEGWVFNDEEFDLTYQIHLPHLLYCDRKTEVVGTLKDLEIKGYSFAPGFAPLVEQRYRVGAIGSEFSVFSAFT